MRFTAVSSVFLVIGLGWSFVDCDGQEKPTDVKGANAPKNEKDAKATLLFNGWKLSPAGRQVDVTDLPLNILSTPDGRHAIVATSGFNSHDLTVVDLKLAKKVTTETVRQSWFGLVADFQAGKLWWSGGGNGKLHTFDYSDGKFSNGVKGDPAASPNDLPSRRTAAPPFLTGLFHDVKQGSLYSLAILPRGVTKSFVVGDLSKEIKGTGVITRIATNGTVEEASAPCGKRPYDVLRARNGLIYVSDWADRCVLVVDPQSLLTLSRIPVGDHPNQLALHPTDDRLFVACASSNGVWVIDTSRGTVQETIFTALFPKSPEGSTPDALCISPDGEMLYVANADNNCVAVIDIETPRRSEVKGFIPTGWYPTSVAITPDGDHLLIGVGKGNQRIDSRPEQAMIDKALEKPAKEGGYRAIPRVYIGNTLSGALSIVEVPDDEQLAKYTSQVYRNCPYSDELLSAAVPPDSRKTAIPVKVGDPSPIKHVIYIIKENRTYDQVFGDIPRGNADPSLVMFGEEVTPNHHKLANEYVLLDNLFCNGQVSRDGHPWSTMAYNTDYIARDWALTYSGRRGIDEDEEGELANAPSGYLWDACKRQGISYRAYKEYGGRVSDPDGQVRMEGRVPGLVGHMSPDFGLPKVPGKRVRDTDNVEVFLKEFREFEKNGTLPQFMILSLGEDHTEGTKTGSPTPQACVASNDLALGRLVEGVSQSKSWGKTAIFVIEDDAQNGTDHVDAHRTIGLVISPFVRRKHLDSTQYSTASMLRTIELILGIPPLSQYDAAAKPMYESFTDQPDLTPYIHEKARIDLDAVNTELAYGAERSNKMDFTEYDRIDDFELNEILWYAIKGPDAPVPPAVRRAIAYRSFEPEIK